MKNKYALFSSVLAITTNIMSFFVGIDKNDEFAPIVTIVALFTLGVSIKGILVCRKSGLKAGLWLSVFSLLLVLWGILKLWTSGALIFIFFT